jgi:hypothetical protein
MLCLSLSEFKREGNILDTMKNPATNFKNQLNRVKLISMVRSYHQMAVWKIA